MRDRKKDKDTQLTKIKALKKERQRGDADGDKDTEKGVW